MCRLISVSMVQHENPLFFSLFCISWCFPCIYLRSVVLVGFYEQGFGIIYFLKEESKLTDGPGSIQLHIFSALSGRMKRLGRLAADVLQNSIFERHIWCFEASMQLHCGSSHFNGENGISYQPSSISLSEASLLQPLRNLASIRTDDIRRTSSAQVQTVEHKDYK